LAHGRLGDDRTLDLMTGILGIVRSRTDAQPEDAWRALMRRAQVFGPPVFSDDLAVLCELAPARRVAVPRDRANGKLGHDCAIAAAGHLRNRAELVVELGQNAGIVDDAALIAAAHRRWGAAGAARMIGDWSYAAWDAAARTLVLSRDHHGNSSVYYTIDDGALVFASSLRQLLSLLPGRHELDELYLAQHLVSWPAYSGDQTAFTRIKRLPPAHHLVVTPNRVETHRYWWLEDTPEMSLSVPGDYCKGFRDVFDRAVLQSLPPAGRVAATLSGGLDSGSVCATAARALGEAGRRLTAYTAVPAYDTATFVGGRFGDELPLAAATAEAAGNVDLRPIDAAGLTPIGAIRAMLAISPQPQHAAGNLFWMLELYRIAATEGHLVLLTGQLGNGGVSWRGSIRSQPLATQLRQLGPKNWLREQGARAAHGFAPKTWRRWRSPEPWARSAIAPDFAKQLRLRERWLDDPDARPHLAPRIERLSVIRPGRSAVGAFHAEVGAAFGVSPIDPTADPRVLSYCFSVPDRFFIEPETGLDRWLIRQAMQDRLPDEVRLNRRRGRQAGDLVPRLRASGDEVEQALDECARGPAARYLAISRMRSVWHRVRAEDSADVFALAGTVLMRGIMAGLFVNGLGKSG
jgi:asparagine synthase (glutamine-hydrolysing)